MRAAVISDSHGRTRFIEKLRLIKPETVLFLGDGERELPLIEAYVQCPVIAVAGNCDVNSSLPTERIFEAEGRRIFMTHGHGYGVKYSLDTIGRHAREEGCAAVLFGHTHERVCFFEEGVWFINPGSAGGIGTFETGFAVVDITPGAIETKFIDL